MPSSSPRCAQFPRAQDKVHFYIKLKELRDQMKGLAPSREVQETQYSFDLQLAKGKQYKHTQGPSPSSIRTYFCLIWRSDAVCSAEDAKRIAIKEEQEDPEYESCSGPQDTSNWRSLRRLRDEAVCSNTQVVELPCSSDYVELDSSEFSMHTHTHTRTHMSTGGWHYTHLWR